MWLEAVRESSCDAEKCPTCGGGVSRRIYGEMYAGSSISNGERVEIRKRPHEGFSDPVVLDPLAVYFDGGLYRLHPSDRYWSRGGKKLHRAVWESAFGPVPKDCHIHHLDGDPGNNSLANLECLPASEHLGHKSHGRGTFSDLAREKAAEWHRSPAGRLWHKRHAEQSKSWTKWKREPTNCLHCQTEFSGLVRQGHSQKYCCEKCKSAHYRERKRNLRDG